MIRRLRMWFASRRSLAIRVHELERDTIRLRRELRHAEVMRVAKETELRERIGSMLRQAAQVEATHTAAVAALNGQLRQERVLGNAFIHRIKRAYELADEMPEPWAAELRVRLSPAMPGATSVVEESPDAAV